MTKRNEHLVVIMLDPVKHGEEFEIWPRKITIVPWFPVATEAKLDEVLRGVARRHMAFSVRAGRIEEWGKDEKLQVQLIDDNGELHKLHWDVFRTLENNGFPIHQKDFLGDKYKPHVTLRNRLQTGKSYKEGEELQIVSFSLIRQTRMKNTGTMIKAVVRDYELR